MDGIEGIIGVTRQELIRQELVATAARQSIRLAASTIVVAILAGWSGPSAARGADRGLVQGATVRLTDRQPVSSPLGQAPREREGDSQALDERDAAAQRRPDRLKPIAEVTTSLGVPPVDYPTDHAARRFAPSPSLAPSFASTRDWEYRVFTWDAAAFCHRPLYFEDENLERYGRSFGLAQPAVSATHFAGRVAAWPYLAVALPPRRCIYNLGREPAGSCAPYRFYRPPLILGGVLSASRDDANNECLDCDVP